MQSPVPSLTAVIYDEGFPRVVADSRAVAHLLGATHAHFWRFLTQFQSRVEARWGALRLPQTDGGEVYALLTEQQVDAILAFIPNNQDMRPRKQKISLGFEAAYQALALTGVPDPPSISEWVCFLEYWYQFFGSQIIRLAELETALITTSAFAQMLPTALLDTFQTPQPHVSFKVRLGKALAERASQRITFGKHNLVILQKGRDAHVKVARWQVTPTNTPHTSE